MPSAATAKLEKQASTEAPEPIRQAIIIIEHKIRNLEKRKRKIESYREEQKNGKDLNSDQLAAVAKYDEVLQTLEFARDLSKQFNGIAIDAAKQLKKQARKEALEKAQQEITKVKEILMVQDVLQNMGQENVREDFLAGRNGAAQLTEDDLKYLDDLYSEVSPKHGCEDGSPPFQEQLQHSAEHLLSIVEGKTKEIVGTTYAKLKELVFTIHTCGYFDQVTEEAVIEQTEEIVTVVEGEVQNAQEGNEEEEYSAEEQQIVTAEAATFPQATQLPQTISAASQPAAAPAMPIPSAMVPQQNVTPVPTPVAAVESSYFSTAAPTFVPAQASNIQQSRPLNEVIGSVNSSFNFLQESELDSPDLSAMLSGAASQQSQARVQPTPPPTGPVAVAPIPSQTFTNQNFASATTASVVPQQVVYQPSSELPQSHIPGFATTPPNPPPPIPMPPSHHQHRSLSPATMQQTYSSQASAPQQVATYASQAQQQPPQQQSSVVVPSSYTTQPPSQQQQQQQQSSQEQSELAQVSEPTSTVPIEDSNDDWGQTSDSQGDWSQQIETQGDWSQQTDSQNDWASSSNNQNDSFTTMTSSRSYGGRGRMNRGGRASSNGYSGGRGRGNYQNGRGGSGGGYGYRNSEGNSNYYQNGYQQRENFGNNNYGGGGYKRGSRAGSGGAPRGGMERGGPRGGAGGRGNNASRGGNRGGGGGSSYVRGGGNKQ